jgi:hypothetical protein
VPAPVGLYLRKTGFRGASCRHNPTTRAGSSTFNPLRTNRGAASLDGVWCAAPPLNLIFVAAGSGARRVAVTQTTRSACRIGRQSLAHESADTARKDRRGYAPPLAPGSSCRLDQGLTIGRTPAKPGSSRRFAGPLGHNNTLNVPYRANPLRTNRLWLSRMDRRGSAPSWAPGYSYRLDQGIAIGKTPAKPGLSGRRAGLPESKNTLNGSRAALGESLAHEP